jgi:hypothetical protein
MAAFAAMTGIKVAKTTWAQKSFGGFSKATACFVLTPSRPISGKTT